MGIETFTGIWSFNQAWPINASDIVAEGAGHVRGLKYAILQTFPNVTAQVTATHTDINSIPNLAPKASPALTGTPTVPTATAGDNSTQAASTAYVVGAIAAAGGGLSVRILDKGRLNFYGG
jgi:hypothetical protein